MKKSSAKNTGGIWLIIQVLSTLKKLQVSLAHFPYHTLFCPCFVQTIFPFKNTVFKCIQLHVFLLTNFHSMYFKHFFYDWHCCWSSNSCPTLIMPHQSVI